MFRTQTCRVNIALSILALFNIACAGEEEGKNNEVEKGTLLLSDWEPMSQFVLHETEVVSARHNIIDMHY